MANKVILGGIVGKNGVQFNAGNEAKSNVAKFFLNVSVPNSKATAYLRCVCFGKRAEYLSQNAIEGTPLLVIGAIQTGSFTSQEGQTIYTTDIIVETVDFTPIPFDINVACISGNLTSDIELKNGQNSKFASGAVGIYRTSEISDFPRFLAFDAVAEQLGNAKKGNSVTVYGHMSTSTSEKDGKTTYYTDVVAQSATFKTKNSQPNVQNQQPMNNGMPMPQQGNAMPNQQPMNNGMPMPQQGNAMPNQQPMNNGMPMPQQGSAMPNQQPMNNGMPMPQQGSAMPNQQSMDMPNQFSQNINDGFTSMSSEEFAGLPWQQN